MSRTLPRASAAKRRGVVLALAAGALALGATAPASASQSSSDSGSAAKGKTSHGPALCVIRADDDSATPTTPTTPTTPAERAKSAKSAERAKSVKLAEAGKAAAVSKDLTRAHDDTCIVIPAFPTDPGKTCKVVVIKRGTGKTDSIPAFPTKPGKPSKPGKPVPTKPGKPGKPGKTCVIVLPKDGHRAAKPSDVAKTAAAEAIRSTRS
ncbi:hypothetical protein [Streptomyces malaysiensis]|uniref:hypothetical protein n=1 Tax=Streptomyces malaysiensis TaxID=92644 RepID=UPI0033D62B05